MNSECFCAKLKNPKFFIQVIIICTCLAVSVYQLRECFRKLIHPPVYTHQLISLNKTMKYPTATVCRWPAYKNHFEKYGLTSPQISYSSVWQTFDFENYTLTQFFEDETYNISEFVATYAIDGFKTNLDVQSVTTLTMGRCFTFTPKVESTLWSSSGGYFFYMRHTGEDNNNNLYSTKNIGFYIYVHELNAPFTEKVNRNSNFLENIFVEIGDALQYKLSVTSMKTLSGQEQSCENNYAYNKAKCQEVCLNKLITEEIGCSTPWLPNSELEECTTARQTQLAVDYSSPDSLYLNKYMSKCNCPTACSSTKFFPYFQGERSTSYEFDSTLSVYYSSSLVTKLEESFGYDENAFLADLGGSLGFLLGLSVLGVIAWIENLILTIALYAKKKKNKELINESSSINNSKSESELENFKNNLQENSKANNDLTIPTY